MNRRAFLSAVAASPLLAALVACGDPDRAPAQADPAAPTNPTAPTTPGTTAAAGIVHPTGPDDVVLKLSYEGGLVPAGFAFVNTPNLLISGDGRVFTQAAVPMIYPGPLLPSLLVRTITEDGVQALLGVVDKAGLLAPPPGYPDRHNVADGSSTVLTINAADGSFVHNAYALGLGDGEDGPRKTLLDVTTALSDVETAAGTANLGADQPFVPATYRFQARVVDPSELTGQDLPPTVVDWPETTGTSLKGAAACARVEATAVGTMFLDAKQNTYFKEGDIVYRLSVAGVLPGDPEC
ncbi:MAG: hypothetical protein ABI949_13625 [Ilumatobacteraceae bacterium]